MNNQTTTQSRLDTLLRDFEELRDRLVGYPCNQDFDYSALLPFFSYAPATPLRSADRASSTFTTSRAGTTWC